MATVTLYTTEPCGFCTATKSLLQAYGVEYAEVNLSNDENGRAELVLSTGMMTFPQVVVDGQLVGGFNETKAALESGRLHQLLAA